LGAGCINEEATTMKSTLGRPASFAVGRQSTAKKCAIAALAISLLALGMIGTATAAGNFSGITPRYYSQYAQYNVHFGVFDADGYCIRDEYGFYNDPSCDDYDANDATLDVRVIQLGGKVLHWAHRGGWTGWVGTPLRHKRVFSEQLDGFGGKADERFYFDQFRSCYWNSAPWRANYQVVFRLFDPVTDQAVDQRSRYYHAWCR
jgi:hypothetical protein